MVEELFAEASVEEPAVAFAAGAWPVIVPTAEESLLPAHTAFAAAAAECWGWPSDSDTAFAG